MYKYNYVNKKDVSIIVDNISFTPYGGYKTANAVPALDTLSNGWDFDRYINNVISNTSNDVAGESKILVIGTKNLYVSTEHGDDNNSGESGAPFRTIQYALDYVAKYYRFGNGPNNSCIINIADGIYEEALIVPRFSELHVEGGIQLLGNTTTLGMVTLLPPASNQYGITLMGENINLRMDGITVDGTNMTMGGGAAVLCGAGARCYIGDKFKLKTFEGIRGFYVYSGGFLLVMNYTLTLEGPTSAYFSGNGACEIEIDLMGLTLINSSGSCFIHGMWNANIFFSTTDAFTGNFTGPKYILDTRAMLQVAGDPSIVPGSSAGIVDAYSTIIIEESIE